MTDHMGQKRKRLDEDADVQPLAKRLLQECKPVPAGVDAHAREENRKAIGTLYAAYVSLKFDGDALRPDEDTNDGDAQAYKQLLDATTAPAPCVLLGAHLLPRFLGRFSSALGASCQALVSLSSTCLGVSDATGKQQQQQQLLQQLPGRADACRAVVSGLGLAARQLVQQPGSPPIELFHTIDALFRHLHVEGIESQPPPQQMNGDGAAAAAAAAAAREAEAAASSLPLLEELLSASPRAVLSCCVQALRGTGGPLPLGAASFVRRLVDRRPTPPAAGVGAAAAGRTNGGQQQQEKDMEDGEDGEAPPRRESLAGAVLVGKPDVGRWLQHTVAAFKSETAGQAAASSHHPLLDSLLDTLPPLEPLDPSAVPRHASWAPPHMEGVGGSPPGSAGARSNRWSRFDVKPGSASEKAQLADQGLLPPHVASGRGQRLATMPIPPAVMSTPRDAVVTEVGRASRCVWMRRLPPQLPESALRSECARYGHVDRVGPPPSSAAGGSAGTDGEAIVTFASIRDAACCYEAMLGSSPWVGGLGPLQASFHVPAGGLPPPSASAPRSAGEQPGLQVWVAGVCSPAGEAEVLRTLAESRCPPPQHLLRVAGVGPGLILQFTSPDVVSVALDVLASNLLAPKGQQQQAPPHVATAPAAAAPAAARPQEVAGDRRQVAERQHHGPLPSPPPPKAAAAVPPPRLAPPPLPLREHSLGAPLASAPPTAAAAASGAAAAAQHAMPQQFSVLSAGGSLPRAMSSSLGLAPPPVVAPPPLPGPPHGSAAAGPPPLPPPALVEEEPAPPLPPGEPGSLWEGKLAKSGVPVACIQCLAPSAAERAAGGAQVGPWPPTLDVQMRAHLSYVLQDVLKGCPQAERAVCRITASAARGGPDNNAAFIKFAQYLGARGRAGVANLPSAGGRHARTAYLIPHSADACEALRVDAAPEDVMLVLLVPAAAPAK